MNYDKLNDGILITNALIVVFCGLISILVNPLGIMGLFFLQRHEAADAQIPGEYDTNDIGFTK